MTLTSVQAYGIVRDRLVVLATGLDEHQQQATIEATPLWTVRDVYSHLVGGPANVLAGEVEGAGQDWWTQRHVDTRRDRSLAEVCAEWQAAAPAFEALQEKLGPRLYISTVDLWHHEQDLRSTMGIEPDRGTDTGRFAAELTLDVAKTMLAEGPAVRLAATDIPEREWVFGGGEPLATVRGTGFELARAVAGRRSRDQLLAFDWDGDAETHLDRVHLWGLPKADLVE